MTELTQEQIKIVQTWGRGMAVMAGAGSGKTTTLVAKCTQLLINRPEAKIVAVSFTERSAGELKVKLSESLLQSLSSHWITTIHGLCAAIVREFPKEAGFEGEETILGAPEAQLYWDRALESLWLDDLPDETRCSLEALLDRESKDSVSSLMTRVKELSPLGIFQFLEKSQCRSTLALEKVAQYVIEKYQRFKRRQGVLDFSDLEIGADRALDVSRICESYHARFDLILVDEFQDTNPLQARMIRKLAKPDSSNLCVVGDPKQSIYRFRDADVSVFEEFCNQMPCQLSLSRNFRSVSGIIEFTNQLCSQTFSASQMKFEPLIPMRSSSQEPVIRLNLQNPIELGQWLLSEVNGGVPLEDFALLLRKIRGNEKWLTALTAVGIPLAVNGGGLFWEDPRVRELVSFLKWWDNPSNTLAGAIFLRAPWVGISDKILDQWTRIDPTWRDPFFKSGHGLAQKLRSYLGQTIRPGELLLGLLMNDEIEAEMGASVLGLWHRVEELSSRGLDFHAIVLELVTAVKENRREREVPAPKNLGQLSVLTLHGSKGLEFPHVILVDFNLKQRAPDSPLLYWDRVQGVYLAGRDEQGNRGRTGKNALENFWRELELKKNTAESKRLFYVALTRARDRLILVCSQPKAEISETPSVEPDSNRLDPAQCDRPKLDPPKLDPWYRDHWRGWIEEFSIPTFDLPSVDSFQPGLKNREGPKASRVEPATAAFEQAQSERKRPRHSVTEWTLLSRCPRAYERTYIRPQEKEKSIEPSKRESLLELGKQVHLCLSQRNFAGLKQLETEAEPFYSADPIIQWATTSRWMVPAELSAGRDVWTELPFELPVGREVLVGSMDRVISEKKGTTTRYSIIDFKLTEKFKSASLLREAYQTQLNLYRAALQILIGDSSLSQIDTLLVNMTQQGVQVVSVPLGDFENRAGLASLAFLSNQIVNGESGIPRPGPLCRFCEFRDQCPEGAQSLLKNGGETECI